LINKEVDDRWWDNSNKTGKTGKEMKKRQIKFLAKLKE
jgi:hypothetical protein